MSTLKLKSKQITTENLKDKHDLKSLILTCRDSKTFCPKFVVELKQLTYLNMSTIHLAQDTSLNLSGLVNLKKLSMDAYDYMLVFTGLPDLEYLSIAGDIEFQDISIFTNLINLETMSISDSKQIKNDNLKNFPKVKSLSLGDNPQITDKCFQYFPHLEFLKLQGAHVCKVNVNCLLTLTNLKSLTVPFNPKLNLNSDDLENMRNNFL